MTFWLKAWGIVRCAGLSRDVFTVVGGRPPERGDYTGVLRDKHSEEDGPEAEDTVEGVNDNGAGGLHGGEQYSRAQ